MYTIKKIPVTIVLLVMLWVGQVWRIPWMVQSGLTAGHVGATIGLSVIALLFATQAERVLGSVRFFLAGFLTHFVCAFLVGAGKYAIGALSGEPSSSAALLSFTLSPMGWIAGSAGFASAWMPRLWRRRVRLALLTLTLTALAYAGGSAGIHGALAAAISIVAGALIQPDVGAKPSLRERRVLVAIVSLSVGVGPALVALNPLASGPFAHNVRLLWAPAVSQLEASSLCGIDAASDACLNALDLLRAHGVGPVVASLIPLLMQVVLAFGLIRGRRLAWSLSCIVQALAIAGLFFQVWRLQEDDSAKWLVDAGQSAIPWVVGLVLLLLSKRLFPVRHTRGFAARAGLRMGIVMVGCAGAWIAATQLMPEAFITYITWTDVFAELPIRFVPAVMALSLPHFIVPSQWFTWLIYEWMGNLVWLYLAYLLLAEFRRSPLMPGSEDRDRAVEILSQSGGDHLQFMTLWEGNRYFFRDNAYVAYRVHHGVALTLGGPVGGEISAHFEDFAQQQGWTVAWYSVDEEFVHSHPFHKCVEVAQEAVLDCSNTEFKGKKFQNIRTARNKAAKASVTTTWCEWADLDVLTTAKLASLSEEWVAEKSLPEMGFTLGGLTEMQVPGTRLLYASDSSGVIQGVTSWLPVRKEGEVVGYTLDVMRRGEHAFNGVIELLISEAMIIANSQGCEWISLSGAPLAGESKPSSQLEALLDRLGQRIEPLYGFRSLAASKQRFRPTHRPWFLCYSDELQLPAIAMAIIHSYLPELKAREVRGIVGSLKEVRREK